jgi:four helix bundle protein
MSMRDLTERTRSYALRIIRLYDALPRRAATRFIADQVVRSGTSVGAHYREATRGRSRAEFVAKVNGGLMELEETLYWIELLEHTAAIPAGKLAPLLDETHQLCAIFVTMIKNAKS